MTLHPGSVVATRVRTSGPGPRNVFFFLSPGSDETVGSAEPAAPSPAHPRDLVFLGGPNPPPFLHPHRARCSLAATAWGHAEWSSSGCGIDVRFPNDDIRRPSNLFGDGEDVSSSRRAANFDRRLLHTRDPDSATAFTVLRDCCANRSSPFHDGSGHSEFTTATTMPRIVPARHPSAMMGWSGSVRPRAKWAVDGVCGIGGDRAVMLCHRRFPKRAGDALGSLKGGVFSP